MNKINKDQATNFTTLQKLTVHELQVKFEEANAKLFAYKFQNALGSLEKTHVIKIAKKEVSQIATALSTKRLAGEKIPIMSLKKFNFFKDANVAAEETDASGKILNKRFSWLNFNRSKHTPSQTNYVKSKANQPIVKKKVPKTNTTKIQLTKEEKMSTKKV